MKLILLYITELFQLHSLLRNYIVALGGNFMKQGKLNHTGGGGKKKSSKLQANTVFQTDNASKTAQCSVTIYILPV